MNTLRSNFVPFLTALAACAVAAGCGGAPKQAAAPLPATDNPNVARVEPKAVMGYVPDSMKNRAPVITPDEKPARVITAHAKSKERSTEKAAKNPEKQKLTPEERTEARRKRRDERKARQQQQATQPSDATRSPDAPASPDAPKPDDSTPASESPAPTPAAE